MRTGLMLIDHDNAQFQQFDLKKIIDSWLSSPLVSSFSNGVCEAKIRAYGGWWQGDMVSDSRFSAASFYSNSCPALTKLENTFWRLNFEFADFLIDSDGNSLDTRIENTFVLRPAPNLFIPKTGSTMCQEINCEAPKIKKWLRKRRGCTKSGCSTQFGDLWIKPEQKQVDIHLTLDLLSASKAESLIQHIAIVSDDIDFLPALFTASQNISGQKTLSHLRSNSKTLYLDQVLEKNSVQLIDFSK